MTGQQFEREVARRLFSAGYWVLNIPRNESGAQPFDILAIKGRDIIATDCKVCEADAFPISRIEPNQWTAFALMWERVGADIGIYVWHDGEIFWVPYWKLLSARASKKNIRIEEMERGKLR